MSGDQSVRILEDVPRVLPGVALGAVVRQPVLGAAEPERAERRTPRPVRISPADKSDGAIENVRPVPGATAKKARAFFVAHLLRKPCGTPVVESYLHRAGNAFSAHNVKRIVSVPVVGLPVLFRQMGMRDRQRIGDRLVRQTPVRSLDTLEKRIRYHRYRVFADHAVGVVSEIRHHRQRPVAPVMFKQRFDKRSGGIGAQNRVERMDGPEGIPQGKSAIEILLAHIRKQNRLEIRMV